MENTRLLHPRLTVLVTCQRPDQPPNIISIAGCTPMSFDPPMVGIGLRTSRLSYEIIKETKMFTINIPTLDLAPQIMWIGKQSGREYNKFAETKLTPIQGVKIPIPHIAECIGYIECQVHDLYECGDHVWVIGKIIHHEIDAKYVVNGRYRPEVKLLYYYLDGYFGTIDGPAKYFNSEATQSNE